MELSSNSPIGAVMLGFALADVSSSKSIVFLPDGSGFVDRVPAIRNHCTPGNERRLI